jgi:DNA-directed RNA polymerase specialized sigma24 family protein
MTGAGDGSGAARLAHGLAAHHEALLAFMRRHARGLLRFESAEDLVQGTHARALAEAERFEFRGDQELGAWLLTLARRHVADRHDHWSALKRGSGRVARLTWSGADSTAGGGAPPVAAAGPGPSTFASRRELLVLAARALAVLLPRDRQLVQWASEDVPVAEQAERLGIGYDAAQRAGLRALERFRKAYRLVSAPRGC